MDKSNAKEQEIKNLIKTHIIKCKSIYEYNKLDVAYWLNTLNIPWKWIKTVYICNINGKSICKMPPEWNFFIQMDMVNYKFIKKMEDAIIKKKNEILNKTNVLNNITNAEKETLEESNENPLGLFKDATNIKKRLIKNEKYKKDELKSNGIFYIYFTKN